MRSLTQIVVTSFLIAGATLGLLYYAGWLSPFEGDDDRPPVVVSSGSVEIESQVDAKDDKRGNFEEVIPGDKKKWRAGHPNGKKPQSLTVIVTGSTTNSPECLATYVHKKVTTVTYSYMPDAGIPVQFKAEIVQNALELNFPVDADWSAGEPYRLSIPRATLRSVSIGSTTCDLGPRGRVEMRQRK